ncbi:MAG: 50S ribosomal protein L11 methyltransferase [Bacteroidetes bacterium]|nr:50S ribosomal protein L11 methyltransferase [Bacteroidota bacterium]
MDYIELNCKIASEKMGSEILMAQLGEIGFESFMETNEGLLAYIPAKDFKEKSLNILQSSDCKELLQFTYEFHLVEDQNWNEVWESNYEAVVICDKCLVRAPFHPKMENIEYDIIIEPKMSFGTAHHETTSLMIEHLLETDLKNKSVLDMGCGTGVLAVLAALKGASNITAIDNDEWAYQNTVENVLKNQKEEIEVFEGDAELIKDKKFDVIIANINRNILLNDMEAYSLSLNKNGILFLSGFYETDLPIIKEKATSLGLNYANHLTKNYWVAAKFVN